MSNEPALKRTAARTACYGAVEDRLADLDPSYPVYCIRDEVLRADGRRRSGAIKSVLFDRIML